MHDLLRLARPDLDRLSKVELVLTATAQKKFIHHRQDGRMNRHAPAKSGFGDQGAQALGGMAVEIAGTVRRLFKVRTQLSFQPVQSLPIKDILDNKAAVPLQYAAYHFDLLVRPDLLNSCHGVSPR